MVYDCNTAKSTLQCSKAKKLHIYPFVADVTPIKRLKDLSAERGWRALKDKTGKNVDMLNVLVVVSMVKHQRSHQVLNFKEEEK